MSADHLKNKKQKLGKSEFEKLLEETVEDSVVDYEQTWKRPAVAPFDPERDAIIFQQIEIDEFESDLVDGIKNPHSLKSLPSLRIYGVNKTGNSVLCHVHGFLPYFYCAAPNGFVQENIEDFRSSLDVY